MFSPKYFKGDKVKIKLEYIFFDKHSTFQASNKKEIIATINEDYPFELPDYLWEDHSLKILIDKKNVDVRIDCVEKI